MKAILYFGKLSLVVCLTSCLTENQKEKDEDEVLEEIIYREKRNAMPQVKCKNFIYL